MILHFKSIAMKKIIFVLTTMLASATLFATTPPEVNQKVLKAFGETFKQPKDVVWHEYENFYEVDFKQGDIKTLSATTAMATSRELRVIILKASYLR